MNFKILISLNSQSLNFGTLSFSMGFFATFLLFGYFGAFIGLIFIYQEYRFLKHYEVFLNDTDFYFSRYYYNEIQVSKSDLIGFTEQKKFFNFRVYELMFKGDRKFRFIEIPKSMLEPNVFSIKDFLSELTVSNTNRNNGMD